MFPAFISGHFLVKISNMFGIKKLLKITLVSSILQKRIRYVATLAINGSQLSSLSPLLSSAGATGCLYALLDSSAVEFNLHDKCARSAEWISMLSTRCGRHATHIQL